MAALILCLLAAQETPVEVHIEAFLKGDSAARAELVFLGAYAIRPLQKAREKSPEKIDAILYELKKAMASPTPAIFDADLKASRGGSGAVNAQMIHALGRGGVPFFLDRIDAARLKSATIDLRNLTSSLKLAEEICRQTGLDFGYFHNHIVFGMPDRLWPSGPATKAPELKGPALERARGLIGKLNDESLEDRESASRALLEMGPSVVPELRKHLARGEKEAAGRCAALIERLAPRHHLLFGRSGAERQKRNDAEEMTLKTLQAIKAGFDFTNCTIADMAAYCTEFSGLPFKVNGESGKSRLTLRSTDQRLFDMLCLVTQSQDLDFVIRDRTILIDTRDAIERELTGKK